MTPEQHFEKALADYHAAQELLNESKRNLARAAAALVASEPEEVPTVKSSERSSRLGWGLEDDQILREEYEKARDNGQLDKLAKKLKRSKGALMSRVSYRRTKDLW